MAPIAIDFSTLAEREGYRTWMMNGTPARKRLHRFSPPVSSDFRNNPGRPLTNQAQRPVLDTIVHALDSNA